MLPPSTAWAERLSQILGEHWDIEHRVYWARDVTFDQDRSQVRTGGNPQAMAVLRNITATLVHGAGYANIAAVLRLHTAHLSEAFALVGMAQIAAE